MPAGILVMHEKVVISGMNTARDLTIIVKIARSCIGSHKIGRTIEETRVIFRTQEESILCQNLETRLMRIRSMSH